MVAMCVCARARARIHAPGVCSLCKRWNVCSLFFPAELSYNKWFSGVYFSHSWRRFPLIFCGNGCCWSWHLLVGWLFIWPEQTYFVHFYPPPSFSTINNVFVRVRVRATFCVHCYFISILPLSYCDYPNGYTELHCIAWLCLWANPNVCL